MNITVRVPVSPTFVSTDLITPGNRKRTTLPAIGHFTRPTRGTQPWGNETTETATKSLVYNSFKPSHLKNVQVCVTHRHFASRVNKYHPVKQPNEVTSLFLSTCRLNDQRLPCPFGSQYIEASTQYNIPSPLRAYNAYTCHECRFAVFPTSKPQRFDPHNKQNLRSERWHLTHPTATALMGIHDNLYNVTSYGQCYNNKQSLDDISSASSKSLPNQKCMRCGKPRSETSGQTHKEIENTKDESAEAVWPCWPPSGSKRKENSQECLSLSNETVYCQCSNADKDTAEPTIKPRPTLSQPVRCDQTPLLQKDHKTQAHNHFHSMFSDPVPDTRDMRKTGRKVVFGGYHTSIFRG